MQTEYCSYFRSNWCSDHSDRLSTASVRHPSAFPTKHLPIHSPQHSLSTSLHRSIMAINLIQLEPNQSLKSPSDWTGTTGRSACQCHAAHGLWGDIDNSSGADAQLPDNDNFVSISVVNIDLSHHDGQHSSISNAPCTSVNSSKLDLGWETNITI